MRYFYIIGEVAVFLILSIFYSCTKELNDHKSIGTNQQIPEVVTNVSISNEAGKAVIRYVIPQDPELLYVEGVYSLENGKEVKIRTSYYNDSILVEGFSDTLTHEVKLYSVSRSGVYSEPIIVQIKPLESFIWGILRSLEAESSFGGFNITASNPNREDISIMVLKKNEFGEKEVDNDLSVYTNTDSIVSKIRGLDTVDYDFGFFIQDHWGNSTDTIYKTFKPLYETQLSPDKFRNFSLPGDAPQWNNGETRVEYAWDGRFGWPWTSFTDQNAGGTDPHMVTMDLGVVARISRIWIRPYPEGDRYYYLTTMKRFEIYGSVNPNLAGELDNSWTLLGIYEVTKPSGLPYGIHNDEDVRVAEAGFDWEVDVNAPPTRYLRFRCLENFAGGTAQSINELKVFGDPR